MSLRFVGDLEVMSERGHVGASPWREPVMRLIALVVIALVGGTAVADPPPTEPTPEVRRPWAVGVAEPEQAIALQFYEQGNAEFVEGRFAQALVLYRDAIKHWDHPAIRFNMAVCLINLDQSVEAKDSLERGLAYGAAPLGEEVFLQGLTYRKLLDSQLTHVKISCQEPGADVSLDGKRLFTAPGSSDLFLLSTSHLVVATKAGFLTASERLAPLPGSTVTLDVRLIALRATTTTMVRRWPAWKPWVVVAAGGVGVGLGALSYYRAANNYHRYDERIRDACPAGCTATEIAALTDLKPTKDRAGVETALGISLFAIGGAFAITGVIGLVLNQPRAEIEGAPSRAVVTPLRGGAAFGVAGSF